MLRMFRPRALPASAPALNTAGRLIYAVGDVHGRRDLLDRLLSLLAADAHAASSPDRPMLVLLGDYIDRGPDSRGVVETVLAERSRGRFDVRALKGNHEQAMLGFLADPEKGGAWLQYGADATLRSYGVATPTGSLDTAALIHARDSLMEVIPRVHLEFLQGLALSVTQGGYAFVHAGVRPGVDLEDQTERDLLGIRAEFLTHPKPFAHVIVHGHTPESEPQIRFNRLGLDTGAYATGVLTAVRLEGASQRIIQATARPSSPWEP